jgi:uncharacterized membrane protein
MLAANSQGGGMSDTARQIESGGGGETGPQQGPQHWAFALLLAFGAAQLISGAVFFFAYNWRDLSDPVKIALPQAAMILAFLVWALLPRASRLGAVAGLAATVMIGVSMAVVGQVYQLGADPWRLFAIWAALALPIAVLMRSDAQFALALAVATAGYALYANEVMWDLLPEGWRESLIIGAYAALAACVLIGRDAISVGAPSWLRWLLAAAALGVALTGGIGDLFNGRHAFDQSFVASLALFAVAAALFFARRHDGPVRAMALFALAAWIGALGIRTIFTGEPNSAGEVAFALFLAALFVVADTAALAAALKHFNKQASSKQGRAS